LPLAIVPGWGYYNVLLASVLGMVNSMFLVACVLGMVNSMFSVANGLVDPMLSVAGARAWLTSCHM